MTEEQKDLQKMADLLKQGATLTELSCPACASPLFKLKSGELWCAKCQKRVIVIKEGETQEEATESLMLSGLESTVVTKIKEVQAKINEEKDPAQLEKLSTTLASLLENLEKIKKMKQ
ncbi:MAG TPA: Sjogren's syndrome/scleroderma autoantigen 1 family protein [Candidatus Bathyarchaeia archaeon]|nr:Sjogren's syndrome/scleroderma autoantigen 1 family protein [Candidatus Bathyarchaeia archaeon]